MTMNMFWTLADSYGLLQHTLEAPGLESSRLVGGTIWFLW